MIVMAKERVLVHEFYQFEISGKAKYTKSDSGSDIESEQTTQDDSSASGKCA